MKRIVSIFMVVALVLSVVANVSAQDVVCGEVLNTDIKAYIDEKPIKSYNIDGWTGIVAEDLRDYGFFVDWDPQARTLSVSKNPFGEITATYEFPENTKPVGSHAADVYKTDIKTYVNGKQVSAFNIGGWTIIYIDELQEYGDVVWNPDERKISYNGKKAWSITLADGYQNTAEHKDYSSAEGIDSISAKFVKNAEGKFDMTGANLDHISWITLAYDKSDGGLKFGFSMIARHMICDEKFYNLCQLMSTVRYDGERIQKEATIANERMTITINGTPVKVKEVTQGKGNNHMDFYFVLDYYIDKDEVNAVEVTIR